MAKKNSLPQCNYCNVENKSEWTFVYGISPCNNYSFCCTEHIPELIKSLSNGKTGEVKVGYLQRWDSLGKYDEKWDKHWREFYNNNIMDDYEDCH